MQELSVIEPEKKEVKFKDDPFFSVIVPIYDLPTMVLKRCLMSLQSQDYEAMEVILVFDGKNKELENIAESFLTQTQDSHGFNSWRKIGLDADNSDSASYHWAGPRFVQREIIFQEVFISKVLMDLGQTPHL